MNIIKLITNDIKNKKIQIRSILFIFLITLSLLAPILFKSVTYAETSVFTDLRYEYDRIMSAKAIEQCFRNVSSIKKNQYDDSRGEGSVQIGNVWNNGAGGGDGNINCNNANEVTMLTILVGLTGAERGLQEFLYPLSGCDKNDVCKKRTGDIYSDLLAIEKTPYNLSDSAWYWYWEQVLINNDYGCGMQRISEGDPDKKYLRASKEYRYEAPGKSNIWKVSNDGTAQKFKYAVFKHKEVKGSALGFEPMASAALEPMNTKSCTEIVKYLTGEVGKNRVDAVIKRLEDKKKTNPNANLGGNERGRANAELETETEPESNEKSCEEQSMLSAGWMICIAVEFFSDKMDKFKENIDELMDVDVASMNNSTTDSLKQSWGFFRILASFLLLAVGIIVVMSQAIGGGS